MQSRRGPATVKGSVCRYATGEAWEGGGRDDLSQETCLFSDTGLHWQAAYG